MESIPVVIQWVVALIGVGGVGKFVHDLFGARSQAKKGDTDNAAVLVTSATGYADKLVTRLNEVSDAFDEFRREQEERNRRQEARNRQDDRLKLVHSQWDNMAASEIRSLGGHIGDPPPLFQPEGIT